MGWVGGTRPQIPAQRLNVRVMESDPDVLRLCAPADRTDKSQGWDWEKTATDRPVGRRWIPLAQNLSPGPSHNSEETSLGEGVVLPYSVLVTTRLGVPKLLLKCLSYIFWLRFQSKRNFRNHTKAGSQDLAALGPA